jgi:hypothetical protein
LTSVLPSLFANNGSTNEHVNDDERSSFGNKLRSINLRMWVFLVPCSLYQSLTPFSILQLGLGVIFGQRLLLLSLVCPWKQLYMQKDVGSLTILEKSSTFMHCNSTYIKFIWFPCMLTSLNIMLWDPSGAFSLHVLLKQIEGKLQDNE